MKSVDPGANMSENQQNHPAVYVTNHDRFSWLDQ